MCNRYRVSAMQIYLAKKYGFDLDKLMPEPEHLPPPELFPKKPRRLVRKQDAQLSLDVMTWGIPRHMKGKSGKPTVSYVTNVRKLERPPSAALVLITICRSKSDWKAIANLSAHDRSVHLLQLLIHLARLSRLAEHH